jgi:hypothetical protein
MDWCPRILLGGAFFLFVNAFRSAGCFHRAKSLSLSFFYGRMLRMFHTFRPFSYAVVHEVR